ncbi:transposase [Alicyclobacillus fodiniaquatilis]|uniref:Transposase n=1 Tax=Alicyclobacillus fodiniaquatilis TaxID=1661150 RepID=A0ABW4JNS1_9BACL
MERRKFSQQFKEQVVKECIGTGNAAIVARKHEIRPNVVNRWVSQYRNETLCASKPHTISTNATNEAYRQLLAEKRELEAANEQIKKTPGEQTLEVSILRDLLKNQTLTYGKNNGCEEVDSQRLWD